MSEEKNVPNIRFKGFTDPWEQRKLGNVGEVHSGVGFPEIEQGGTEGIAFYKVSDMNIVGNESVMKKAHNYVNTEQIEKRNWKIIKHVPAIIFAKVGAAIMLNRKRIVQSPFLIDNNIMTYIFDKSWDVFFGKTLFDTINLPKYAQTGALPSYNASDIKNIKVLIPNKNLQTKIGVLFKKIDTTIALHQQKVTQLKELKKLLMQKIFDQEWRFRGFTDPWEQRKLGDVSSKVTEKNKSKKYTETLTNSAEYGIINQYAFFDKSISNSNSIASYYVVKRDNFVYNPRISTAAPVGPINRNRLNIIGIMSPLYYVFEATNIDKSYLEYYFKTTKWHNFMKIEGNTGARSDRLAIKDKVLVKMPIPYPKVKEQKQIGELFESIDTTIALHQQKVDQLKELKKYLMQNLFV
ncbi:restriction endonuclease subunit S [Pediococcus acidilactici]|uniref:restriction endonuclease subunit S n=1 Tax=Pediococcus acidilactici TaxID=1254 RepID=UPI00207354FB|nr:restriction endonuclease subunit S [Pediococcus acidilactici]